MRVIMIGCEYAGKTTLATEVAKWWTDKTGSPAGWHDHFMVPHLAHPNPKWAAEADQILTLQPTLLEKLMRYMIEYHLSDGFYRYDDHLLIDFYYAEAVYAPMYYGYSGPDDDYANRPLEARWWDNEVLNKAPDTVLVLVKASPEVIRRRMQENPHPKDLLKEQDVETVLARFEDEYNKSLLWRRFTLDTTSATVQETFKEFVRQIEHHLTEKDRLRILSHQTLKTEPC